jgi:hypothetical protein
MLPKKMSNKITDTVTHYDRRYRLFRRRLRSSTIRDPNGSRSTFQEFYQSGGRDYEQYRLWLQKRTCLNTTAESPSLSNESMRIKAE